MKSERLIKGVPAAVLIYTRLLIKRAFSVAENAHKLRFGQ